jgi:hypothetical protein
MAIPLLDAVHPAAVITPPLPPNAGVEHMHTCHMDCIPDLPTVAAGELCIRVHKIMQGFVCCVMQRNYRQGKELLEFAMVDIIRAGHLIRATERAMRSLQQHKA